MSRSSLGGEEGEDACCWQREWRIQDGGVLKE